MSGWHDPYAGLPPAHIFRSRHRMGFVVGETFAPFRMAREDERPPDWQGGPDITSDRIPGSTRTLHQDLGALELTLTTNLMFRDARARATFWSLIRSTGELWMDAARTMWPPDREWHEGGIDYAIFDNVLVLATGAPTFDLRGVPMLAEVVFGREDTTPW